MMQARHAAGLLFGKEKVMSVLERLREKARPALAYGRTADEVRCVDEEHIRRLEHSMDANLKENARRMSASWEAARRQLIGGPIV